MPCIANSESRWADTPPKASRTTVTASESTFSSAPPCAAGTVSAARPLSRSASRMPGWTSVAASASPAWSRTESATARARSRSCWWCSGRSNDIAVLPSATTPAPLRGSVAPGRSSIRRRIPCYWYSWLGCQRPHPLPRGHPRCLLPSSSTPSAAPWGAASPAAPCPGCTRSTCSPRCSARWPTRNGLDPGTRSTTSWSAASGRTASSRPPPAARPCSPRAGPSRVPSVTIERKCGSGQQALDFAVQGVLAGAYDIAVAAGVESMSRVPMGSARGDADPHGPRVTERYAPGPGAAGHLRRARRAEVGPDPASSSTPSPSPRTSGPPRPPPPAPSTGRSSPITTPDGVVSADETIRPGSQRREARRARSRRSPPARTPPGSPTWTGRSPPGNSSQLTDGAAALLVMSEERAAALGLTPRARIVATAVTGDDPLMMLTGPIPATHKLLAAVGPVDRRHRRLRGQRGVRLRAAGLAGRVRRSPTSSSTPAAARSPSATRSAPPAPGWPPRCSATSRTPAGATDCRRCARPAAWPTHW